MDQTVELPGSMPAAAAAAAATAAAGALGSTRPGELLTMQSCPAIHTDMQARTLLSICMVLACRSSTASARAQAGASRAPAFAAQTVLG